MRVQKPSGFIANKRGQDLEKQVSHILEYNNYIQVLPVRFFSMRFLKQPIFAQQFMVGRDIYGKLRRCDFIIFHPQNWKNGLVIQCKWQASTGSVEEKYPFEVLNIKKMEYPTIVILDGGGYSKGAEKWLKNQIDNTFLLHVFTLGEFQRFVSQGNL